MCIEKQEDFRNSVQCLDGWILELFKNKKIDAFDKDVGIHYLRRLVVCSKLDPNVKSEKPTKGE